MDASGNDRNYLDENNEVSLILKQIQNAGQLDVLDRFKQFHALMPFLNLEPRKESENVEQVSEEPLNLSKPKSEGSLLVGELSSFDAKPPKKAHIKRPMNAFMIWSQSERKRLLKMNPDLHNSQISKQLGTKWKELSDAEKKPFYDQQLRLSQSLLEQHPDYRYKPRRKRVAMVNGQRVKIGDWKKIMKFQQQS